MVQPLIYIKLLRNINENHSPFSLDLLEIKIRELVN